MSEHEQWDVVTGVGLTALGVAAIRAVEDSRPDRLVADPYAAAFVNAVDSPIPKDLRWSDDPTGVGEPVAVLMRASTYVGVRTRFFDDYLLAAARAGVAQVVVLAAGLDTRAYRLDWPAGVTLFEVDQPKVLEFKEAVLGSLGAAPRCARRAVPADLRADWREPLRDQGFDPGSRTVWQAEGLLQYLPAEAEHQLFGYLDGLSAVGSRLAVERTVDVAAMMDTSGLRDLPAGDADFSMDRLVRTDSRQDPATWLAGRGWQVSEERATAVADRYHRVLQDPRLAGLPGTALHLGEHNVFLCAQRTGSVLRTGNG
jgi:methyltransferase (TIGR00027 family)